MNLRVVTGSLGLLVRRFSRVMASVSFAGLLSHAKTSESIPDKWYPRMSSQHPSWPHPGRVHVLAASSSWQMTTCTVTFGFWTFIESAGADQCYCLTNQAVQELILRLDDRAGTQTSNAGMDCLHYRMPLLQTSLATWAQMLGALVHRIGSV